MEISPVEQLIGSTPLLDISGILDPATEVTLLAKYEAANPGGSVKDRIAQAMLDDAQQRGLLDSESHIIEPTSGNTGIGLAMLAAARGYRLTLVMPDTMSKERRGLLAAFGARLVLTDGARGMAGAIERAEELAADDEHAFMPRQFENPTNPRCHFENTGPEIWNGAGQKVDIFIAGVGTGGTITGAGSFLKQKNPALRVVAVEPSESPVLSGGVHSPHKIQGIGAGFVPRALDTSVYSEIVTVSTEEAFASQSDLACRLGLFVGISSGAAVAAARCVAARPESAHKTVVTVLPDTGERYLSLLPTYES